MKRRLLRLLARAGLLRPAFRAWEALLSFRAGGRSGSADGIALPPRRLMVRVAGTADPAWFLESGRAGYEAIAASVAVDELRSVLDFGCGCGRVTRWWRDFEGDLVGTDLSRSAISWCRRALPYGRFETNGLRPPLAFSDESFDLVYALSVFTHLTPDLQLAWRDELRRVLRPGGLLLVTTHGRSYLPRLEPSERERFEAGGLVVRWRDLPGTNLCSAYHPEPYLRDAFAGGFAFLKLEPEGARGNPTQDLVLLRKE